MSALQLNLKELKVIPALCMLAFSFYVSLDFTVIDKQMLSYANLAFVLLSFVFAVFLTMRHVVIRQFDFIVIAYLLFTAIFSLINGMDWKNWIYYSASIITVTLLFNFYSANLKPLIIGAWIGLFLAILWGSYDILSHPEKWIVDNDKDITGYLLGGNYNGMGCRILLALLVNMVCVRITKLAWLTLIPLILFSLVDLFIVRSMTAVTCVILFFILCAIPNLRLQRFATSCTLAFVVLFEIVVCFSGKGLENNEFATWFIVDVLDKDITFTNRTEMWDSALRIITHSPIWGYGYPEANWYTSNMSSFAIGPHNMILAVLIYGGIIALTMYIALYIMALRELFHYYDRTANILYAAITMLSFMMLMEAYPIQIILMLLILGYGYGDIKGRPEGESHLIICPTESITSK